MYIYLVSIYTNECYKYIILQYNLNIKTFYPRFFPYIVTVLFSNINPPPSRNLKKNLWQLSDYQTYRDQHMCAFSTNETLQSPYNP